MKRKRLYPLFIWLLVFAALIALAIWQQSAYLLYAASAVPLVAVPFLPDIRSKQKLKASKNHNVQIFKLAPAEGEPANQLIVQFQPGIVNWNCKMLYIDLKNVPTVAKDRLVSHSASVPVLTFDLELPKRKSGMIGIRLQNIKERTSSFSFTTDEITRLVVRLDDLTEHAAPSLPVSGTPATGSRMQA